MSIDLKTVCDAFEEMSLAELQVFTG